MRQKVSSVKWIGIWGCCFFLLLMSFNTSVWAAGVNLEIGKWIDVEISRELKEHLMDLPEDEKPEQMRDWIVLGFVNYLEVGKAEAFKALFDLAPMRYEFLQAMAEYKYGESRYICLSNDELYVFVPYRSSKADVYIARTCDEYRMIFDKKPARTTVIEYDIKAGELPIIKFALGRIIDKKTLFSPQMGYYWSTIRERDALVKFLEQVDDIVYVGFSRENEVLMGGRRFDNFRTRSVTIEDVAAIYQADIDLKTKLREELARKDYAEDYQKVIDMQIEQLKKDEPIQIFRYPGDSLEKKLKTELPYEKFVPLWVDQNLKLMEPSIGFSLDHQVNYKKFANVLKRMLSKDKEFTTNWLMENYIKFEDDYLKFERDTAKRLSAQKGSFTGEGYVDDREISLVSLINGRGSFKNEKLPPDRYDSQYQESWFILVLNAVVAKNSIIQRKEVLLDIAERSLKKELTSYYRLRKYLNGKWPVHIQRTQKPFSPFEKMIFRDIVNMLSKAGYLKQNEKTVFDGEVLQAVKKFQAEHELESNGIVDNKTFATLLNDERNTDKQDEFMRLDSFLEKLKRTCSYQKARYDGNFKGTRVGITMFYTDLLMKLWSLDYKNSAPQEYIMGFLSQSNYPLDYIHLDDVETNPATRSWLGPLDSGYEIHRNSRLCFSHISTRIYDASSNDLEPGKEVDANASSARFSSWWNNHYTEVADYEPEYHRLNQVMKWSVILPWLKSRDLFAFLKHENVTRDLDFEQWWGSHDKLKTGKLIAFLDRAKLGEDTECIGILYSNHYIGFWDKITDQFDVYQLSGGVSLARPREVLKIRKDFVSPRIIPNKLRTGLDKVKKFILPKGKKITIDMRKLMAKFTGKPTKIRSKIGEFKKFGLERRLKTYGNKRMNLIEKAGDKKLGEWMCRKDGGKLHIAYKQENMAALRNVLRKAKKKGGCSAENMDALNDVQHMVKINKTDYLVKVKGPDKYFKFSYSRVNKKSADISISVGKNRYLHARAISKAEYSKTVGQYRWCEAGLDSSGKVVTKLSKTAPANSRTVYITKNGKTVKTRVSPDSTLVENGTANIPAKIQDNVKFLNSLKNEAGGVPFRHIQRNLPPDKNALLGFYDKNGRLIMASNKGPVTGAQETLVRSLIPNSKGNIKGVIFSKKPDVKLLGDNFIQVPYRANPATKNVAEFVIDRMAKNKSWKDVFGRSPVKYEDVRVLREIHPDNISLGKSFHPFKKVNNLPDKGVLMNYDYHAGGVNPQVLIKIGKRQPQVMKLDKIMVKNPASIGKELDKIYRANGTINQKQFLDMTEPIAKLYKDVAVKTNCDYLIVVGPKGINPTLIARLHKLPRGLRIVKDQVDVGKSVKNAYRDIHAEVEGALFLSTVSLEHKDYKEVGAISQGIKGTGLKIKTGLTAKEFLEIIKDPSQKQIALLVRANQDGLIFPDGVLKHSSLKLYLLLYGTEKEMMYIISNESEKLQKLFADTGKFNFVFASNYLLKNNYSFNLSLKNLRDFYNGYLGDTSVMKKSKYKKLVKEFNNLAATFSKITKKVGKKYHIQVGKLTREQRKIIHIKAQEFIGKYIPGKKGKPFRFPTLKEIIDNVQIKRIKTIQKIIQKDFMNFLRAIPVLKVQTRVRQTRFVYG